MADYTTIDDPAQYFTSFLWTGDGNSPRSLTGVGFQADFMWSKLRDTGHEHSVVDTVRGVDNKRLKTDSQAAEDTTNTHGHFDSLDSDGFTVTGASGYWNVNTNTKKYVGWFWKAGNSSGSSNTDGSVTSTVSASTASGFSIARFTGTGSNLTIGHGLGVKPDFIILKCDSSGSTDWTCYHSSLGATKRLKLNATDASSTNSTTWQDTEPTTSVISIGTSGDVNVSSGTHIVYSFANIQGYSKFGSFEGNNNADGSFVYLGFKPAWVMIKDIDSQGTVGGTVATSWGIWDSKRMPNNPASNPLWASHAGNETIRGNNSSANTGGSDGNGLGGFIHLDMLSNGFKCRSATAELNGANTYVYMAFAEAPFVNSNGVPCNAK